MKRFIVETNRMKNDASSMVCLEGELVWDESFSFNKVFSSEEGMIAYLNGCYPDALKTTGDLAVATVLSVSKCVVAPLWQGNSYYYTFKVGKTTFLGRDDIKIIECEGEYVMK